MAKSAETSEHFIIHVGSVPKDQLGHLLSLLAREGFFDVRPELVTNVVRFNKKQSHEVKAEDFLIDWIAEHPTFRAIEAIKHFREAGRTNGAGYTALRTLVERKLLRKVSPGQYSTLAAKHQPKGIKAAKKAAAKKKPAAKHHDVPAPDFALRLMSRNHGVISSNTLKRHFESDGRSPTGVGPVLNKLLQAKKIKRTGEGQYALAGKKPAAKANGAQAPVTEVTAHG